MVSPGSVSDAVEAALKVVKSMDVAELATWPGSVLTDPTLGSAAWALPPQNTPTARKRNRPSERSERKR